MSLARSRNLNCALANFSLRAALGDNKKGEEYFPGITLCCSLRRGVEQLVFVSCGPTRKSDADLLNLASHDLNGSNDDAGFPRKKIPGFAM